MEENTKLSDALEKGFSLATLDPMYYNTCLLGQAARIAGVKKDVLGDTSVPDLEAYWPWLKEQQAASIWSYSDSGEQVMSGFGFRIHDGKQTIDDCLAWLRSIGK